MLLYIKLPKNDFFMLNIIVLSGIIGDIKDIIAITKYVIISASAKPYIMPPNLSNCFIIGNFVIQFDIIFNTTNIL